MVAQALDKELNAVAGSAAASAAVNDLTSMVVKKKKKAPVATDGEASPTKRKADDSGEGESLEKKVKTGESE
jgi:HAT1-interacting factor 1